MQRKLGCFLLIKDCYSLSSAVLYFILKLGSQFQYILKMNWCHRPIINVIITENYVSAFSSLRYAQGRKHRGLGIIPSKVLGAWGYSDLYSPAFDSKQILFLE